MVTLVLLPGLDGTGLLFADFAAAFGPAVETIVVTYPPDLPLDYLELEAIARAFLPLDRPYFLLAESFSGPLGMAIAASRPPGLCGLILSCSFARNPLPVSAVLRPVLGLLPLNRMPLGLLSFFLLGRFSSSRLCQALADSLALLAPAVWRARAEAILAVNASAKLPGIRVPVLYLRATEDRLIRQSAVDFVASFVPHMRVIEFEAPHFLLQVLPKPAALAIGEFMAEHATP